MTALCPRCGAEIAGAIPGRGAATCRSCGHRDQPIADPEEPAPPARPYATWSREELEVALTRALARVAELEEQLVKPPSSEPRT